MATGLGIGDGAHLATSPMGNCLPCRSWRRPLNQDAVATEARGANEEVAADAGPNFVPVPWKAPPPVLGLIGAAAAHAGPDFVPVAWKAPPPRLGLPWVPPAPRSPRALVWRTCVAITPAPFKAPPPRAPLPARLEMQARHQEEWV